MHVSTKQSTTSTSISTQKIILVRDCVRKIANIPQKLSPFESYHHTIEVDTCVAPFPSFVETVEAMVEKKVEVCK